MRPRLIASVPGLSDPSLSPFDRFEKFARMIVSVPKEEADKVAIHERQGGSKGRPVTRRQENGNGKQKPQKG